MQSTSWLSPQIAPATSALPPTLGKRPQVEIEGDGLEGQRPPLRRTDETPDDPSEPFSPNYGAAPALEANGAPEPA